MDEVFIRKENVDRLEELVSIPHAQLDEAISLLSRHNFVPDPEKLEKLLGTKLNHQNARLLVGFGTTFATLADQKSTSVEEVLAATKRALSKMKWSDESLSAFEELQPKLAEISKSKAFSLGAKAAALFRATGLHVHEVRSVVDIRPLFNHSRDEILANIIFCNISITASDGNEEEKLLNFMMDYEDVKKLKEECERALRKLEGSYKMLSGCGAPQPVIYGKDDDG
jgi:hypothetical protein